MYLDDTNMDTLEKQANNIQLEGKVHRTGGYDEVCKRLASPDQPKIFLFSTPHGAPADKCVEALKPHLMAGDAIIDCGNEHWTNVSQPASLPPS